MPPVPAHLSLDGQLWLQHREQKFLGSERLALLAAIEACGSITRAAQAVGISYKTAWDAVNQINNLAAQPLVERLTGGKGGGGAALTAAGKALVAQLQTLQEEHAHFLTNLQQRLGDGAGLLHSLRRIAMKVSARNTFSGTIATLTAGGVNAEVVLTLKGGVPLVATVTNGAVAHLGLKPGMTAYAIVKASSVIVGTDLHAAALSARNRFCGTISRIVAGPVNVEVDVEIGGGNTVSAVITQDSAAALGLREGGHACTLFKASSVIIGVD